MFTAKCRHCKIFLSLKSYPLYRGGICTQAINLRSFFSSKRNCAEDVTDLCITDPTVLSALQSTNSAVRDFGWYTVLITSHRIDTKKQQRNAALALQFRILRITSYRIDTTKQQRKAALALQFRILRITSYRIDTTSSKEKRLSHSVPYH